MLEETDGKQRKLCHKIKGVPINMGNKWQDLRSSLLIIIIVIPDFKSYNLIMPARIYFMKQ